MSKPVYVVIPFKDEAEMTISVIDQLDREDGFVKLYLYDNGSSEESRLAVSARIESDHRMELIDAAGRGIYEMWNLGWKKALEANPDCYILFLNNDITIGNWFIQSLSWVMDHDHQVGITYPNYDRDVVDGKQMFDSIEYLPTSGTYKDGGMCGWAFLLRGSLSQHGLPFVDENLRWWFGDDFIEMKVRELGYRVVRLLGLPVDHLNEATARNGANEWTHVAKQEDLKYWNANYG